MKDVFHAYDIRGVVPEEINPNFAFDLGKAIATVLKPTSIIVGRDARSSSEELLNALIEGLRSVGVTIVNLGLVSTPQFYFSLISSYADGGIMVTASHNPKEYNGFKICGPKAEPIFSENKLPEIKKVLEKKSFIEEQSKKGKLMNERIQEKYEEFFTPLPYNSGYFMCIELKENLDAEKVRHILLSKYDTGIIAMPPLIRIAFSAVAKTNIKTLFENIYSACKEA